MVDCSTTCILSYTSNCSNGLLQVGDDMNMDALGRNYWYGTVKLEKTGCDDVYLGNKNVMVKEPSCLDIWSGCHFRPVILYLGLSLTTLVGPKRGSVFWE